METSVLYLKKRRVEIKCQSFCLSVSIIIIIIIIIINDVIQDTYLTYSKHCFSIHTCKVTIHNLSAKNTTNYLKNTELCWQSCETQQLGFINLVGRSFEEERLNCSDIGRWYILAIKAIFKKKIISLPILCWFTKISNARFTHLTVLLVLFSLTTCRTLLHKPYNNKTILRTCKGNQLQTSINPRFLDHIENLLPSSWD